MGNVLPMDQIGSAVSKMLDLGNITEPPIDLYKIISACNIVFESLSDEIFDDYLRRARFLPSKGILGMSLPVGTDFHMYVRDSLPPMRKRTSIAHELGHYIQFRELGREFSFHKTRMGDVSLCIDKAVERNAFEIGEHLLMPDSMLIDYISSAPLGMSTIEHCSNMFDVSFDVAGIRVAGAHAMPVGFMRLSHNHGRIPNDPYAAFTVREHNPVPYTIKYCVLSDSFPEQITPGQLVKSDSIIDLTWKERKALRKFDIGSWCLHKDIPFYWGNDEERIVTMGADCTPWSRHGFFALVWKP